MTAAELARLYLDQLRADWDGVPPAQTEPNAVFVWEELICSDPEQAWPVFEELLAHAGDDDTLEQVWYRLRLLLHHHYDSFHERAEALLARYERLAVVAGPEALDPEAYEEKPFDREALIRAYRVLQRTQELHQAVITMARSDPERALTLAVEIIHRGLARGWKTLDVMFPLGELLAANAAAVADRLEELASRSSAVRRVLWRLQRQLYWSAMDAGLRERLERAAGGTTDYNDPDAVIPVPEQQPEPDERLIDAWFVHEKNFWAFSSLNDLCDDDPRLAWDITLELIARAEDEGELGLIAAGPLEDLVRKHAGLLWDEVVAKAYEDARFRTALHGVWVFPRDGPVYHRFTELMATLEAEPN